MITATPPTDNLYKFIAIFGLTLIGLGVFLYNDSYNNLRQTVSKYVKLRESTALSLKNRQTRLKTLEIIANKLKDKEFIDHVVKLLDADTERNEYLAEKESALFEMESATKHLETLRWLAFSFCIGGAAISSIGFLFWYIRFQSFQDRLLQLKVLTAKVSTSEKDGKEQEHQRKRVP